ncbi:MAG: protein-L-isoaspartate(D-aspartate) O-methyltransferase [Proteobacteria bacterium]|nr:protein-L-isoaspartate(D-aspartate) O-methyltransferase [Pseudomonadota bacterium]
MAKRALLLVLAISFLSSFPFLRADESSFTQARRRMVAEDLQGRDIIDPRVLAAMEKVPRHRYVSKKHRPLAYADHPLPIAEGQTISQPYVVALMTQALKLKRGDRVLEIGTGSGYQASILGELTPEVYTIEIREGLVERSKKILNDLDYRHVKVKHGDGYFGWEEHAPFDAIIVTAAANHIPPPLIEQLQMGGRLIIPLGSTTYWQTLTLIEKKESGLDVQHLGDVSFVPMIGEVQKRD